MPQQDAPARHQFHTCTVVLVVAVAARVANITRGVVVVAVIAGQRRDRRTPDTSPGRRRRDIISVSRSPRSAHFALPDRWSRSCSRAGRLDQFLPVLFTH